MSTLDIVRYLGEGKYLGLLYLIGKSKKQIFQSLKIVCGRRSKDGKRSFSHRAGKSCLSNQCCKTFQHTQCNAFLF